MQDSSQQVDRLFQALADPYRRGMVEQLSRGPASVKALAAPTDIGLPSVLKHLRVLEAGGIVRSEKSGRVRTYRMEPAALAAISDWVVQREAALNDAFGRLAQAMADFPEAEEE